MLIYIILYGIFLFFSKINGENYNRNNLALNNKICYWSDTSKNEHDEECTIICHRGDTISVQQAIINIINIVN